MHDVEQRLAYLSYVLVLVLDWRLLSTDGL